MSDVIDAPVLPPARSVPRIVPPPPTSGLPVQFVGERARFRHLVLRGAALELFTAGFYRFWLATDMRRHLWSNTLVGDDPAEYSGSPKELLIGFLFALAILAPLNFVYFLAGLEAERVQAMASVPLGLFFLLFAQFALYRARRYRLTRTVWRGVRFYMGGSGWNYALRAGLWNLLTLLTLGLALPWRDAALERYKMRNTNYGELVGRFEGTGTELFKRGWWLWLLFWPSIALFPALPFVYAAYKATSWRWWIEGLRFGEVRLESTLPRGALIGVYWKLIGWATVFSAVLGAWSAAVIAVGAAMFGGDGTQEQQMAAAAQHPAVLIGIGLGYVANMLAFGAVMRIYLTRDVWAIIARTTIIHNLAAADNVTTRGDLVGALGEGFADSLDVAGF